MTLYVEPLCYVLYNEACLQKVLAYAYDLKSFTYFIFQLVVSTLMFRTLIYFLFHFSIYRHGSRHNLPHEGSQFFQYHLLNRLSFCSVYFSLLFFGPCFSLFWCFKHSQLSTSLLRLLSVCPTFQCVELTLPFNPRNCLISSSVAHCLVKSELFSFYMFAQILCFVLLLISSFLLLWSRNIHGTISILLRLLKLILLVSR